MPDHAAKYIDTGNYEWINADSIAAIYVAKRERDGELRVVLVASMRHAYPLDVFLDNERQYWNGERWLYDERDFADEF